MQPPFWGRAKCVSGTAEEPPEGRNRSCPPGQSNSPKLGFYFPATAKQENGEGCDQKVAVSRSHHCLPSPYFRDGKIHQTDLLGPTKATTEGLKVKRNFSNLEIILKVMSYTASTG